MSSEQDRVGKISSILNLIQRSPCGNDRVNKPKRASRDRDALDCKRKLPFQALVVRIWR